MITKGTANVSIDLIRQRSDIAELAKLAAFLDWDMALGRSYEEPDSANMIRLQGRNEEMLLPDLLAGLVAVAAVAQDVAYPDVLKAVEAKLEGWHMTKKRPSDSRGIGSGHADDE